MSTLIERTRSSRAKRAFLVLGVVLLAALAVLAFRLGREESEVTASQSSAGQMEGMAGMDMSTDGSVRLSSAQIQQFGITFGSVEERVLSEEIRTVGIVAFDETRLGEVTLKFGGYVEQLHADFTGQPVRSGQPLLEIYSPELVSAQEELLLAARLDRGLAGSPVPGISGGGSNLAEVARRRLTLWDIPEAEIDAILASGDIRRTMTVRAPVSGIVVEKPVLRGQAVMPGQTLYRIADLSRVWVEAELREIDAGGIREGSSATVELAAFPGRPLQGVVEYVYPTVEQEARTLKARVALANPEGLLRPGMYATVRLAAPARTALTVPSAAVIATGTRHLVFVDLGGGRLMPSEIVVGRTTGDLTEVVSGLFPGQRVVTSAQYLLDSESNLGEVMRSMVGQGADMGGMDMGGAGAAGMDDRGADMRGMPGMEMPDQGR